MIILPSEAEDRLLINTYMIFFERTEFTGDWVDLVAKKKVLKLWNYEYWLLQLFYRIEEQLMFTLPDNENAPLKTILLGNGLGAWGVSKGRGEFIKNQCPVDRCVITSDSREAGTADAILFKDHFTPFSAKRPTKQVWHIFYLELHYGLLWLWVGSNRLSHIY